MILETEANIYLAEKRECFQTEFFRSYLTDYQYIIKYADNTLAAQGCCNLLAKEDCLIILIPLVGAIETSTEAMNKFVEAGEIGYFHLKKNDNIFIQNPYETELINYLEIWLKVNSNDISGSFFEKFDIEKQKNKLIQLGKQINNFDLFIGKFEGRREGILSVKGSEKVFVFVINGVFEVQNRLLEVRSGLTLCNTNSVEFEALAVDNIILIMKV